MIASGTIIIDGQTYRKGDIIHDLGGWDCVDTDGSKRYYWGKSSEVDKLPQWYINRYPRNGEDMEKQCRRFIGCME